MNAMRTPPGTGCCAFHGWPPRPGGRGCRACRCCAAAGLASSLGRFSCCSTRSRSLQAARRTAVECAADSATAGGGRLRQLEAAGSRTRAAAAAAPLTLHRSSPAPLPHCRRTGSTAAARGRTRTAPPGRARRVCALACVPAAGPCLPAEREVAERWLAVVVVAMLHSAAAPCYLPLWLCADRSYSTGDPSSSHRGC